MHNPQFVEITARDIARDIGIWHVLGFGHYLAGDFGDHVADCLGQEEADVLHCPADGFLALLDTKLGQVIVGVYVGCALADLFFACNEVFVAFHYVSGDL